MTGVKDGASAPPSSTVEARERKAGRVLPAFVHGASWLFGLSLVGLSLFVSLETVLRKAFNYSFEGADELGGYVLAVGSSLAFAVALFDRAHIRIDILHQRLPRAVQGALDWVSIVSMAALGLFMLYVGYFVLIDTIAYGSTAPTPWRTPLIWPQGLWYAALALFALVAIVQALRATWLLVSGQRPAFDALFSPKGELEELEEELSDVKRR